MIIENAIVIEETNIAVDLRWNRHPVFNITFRADIDMRIHQIGADIDMRPYQIQTFSIKEAFRKAIEYGLGITPIYFNGLDYEAPKLVDDVLKLQLYLTFN
jgi:hypothetical protein